MRQHAKKILFSLFLSFSLAACQATGVKQAYLKDQKKEKGNAFQVPSWVTKRSTAKYPSSLYLIGIGVSNKSHTEADNAARMDLSKQIQVNIKGVDIDIISETQSPLDKNMIPSIKKESSSTVQTSVDLSLKGLTVAERWFNPEKNRYYSLAVLDRSRAASAFRRKIQMDFDIIKSNFSQGNLFKKDHKLGQALRHYLMVHQKRKEISPVISQYDVVWGVFDDELNFGEKLPSLNSLENNIQDIVSSLKIVDISGNMQEGKIGKALKDELKAKLVYEKGSENYPVPSFPMKFEFEKGRGELIKEVSTNQDGYVSSKVYKVEPSSDRLNFISLAIDKTKLFSGLKTVPDSELMANLNEVRFLYTFTLPRINDRRVAFSNWDAGIKELINQIINNLDEKKGLKIAVVGFSEIDGKNNMPFSKILQEDIQTGLALVEDINVINHSTSINDSSLKEIALQLGADMYLTGMYRMENRGLVINARMIDLASSGIRSVAKILINENGLNDSRLSGIEVGSEMTFSQSQGILNTELELEKLINLEKSSVDFEIDLWTNKKVYRIGDNVYFYFKADRNCYVTIFDIGTSGQMKILFPNSIHHDNFILANKVYTIPGENYGFDISVSGPSGIERIKVIASEKRPSIPLTDETKTFYAYDRSNISFARLFMEQLKETSWSQDYVEIRLIH